MDLLYKMYGDKDCSKRGIPMLVPKNNPAGFDADKRAAQPASFALILQDA